MLIACVGIGKVLPTVDRAGIAVQVGPWRPRQLDPPTITRDGDVQRIWNKSRNLVGGNRTCRGCKVEDRKFSENA